MISRRYFLITMLLILGMGVLLKPSVGFSFSGKIELGGKWRFQLDEKNVGRAEEWFNARLSKTIRLPGTTDKSGYGKKTVGAAVGHLTRVHEYIGAAWYQRDFEVPESWENKRITLFLERCKWKTTVWVDGKLVGSEDGLSTPHAYVLPYLHPGRHTVTIEIDNSLIFNIGIWGHSYTEETQSIWNGAVGRIELLATDRAWLEAVRVFPGENANAVRHEVCIGNDTGGQIAGSISGKIVDPDGRTVAERTFPLTVDGKVAEIDFYLDIADDITIQRWDEFTPTLYTAEILLNLNDGKNKLLDNRRETFGFRTIAHDGSQVTLNGRQVFLRGTTDCATYPLTGHPPMDVEEWMLVFRTIKEHGMNHVRYHTWCPPEAAFTAADRLGMILQPEAPIWIDGWMSDREPNPRIIGKDPEVVAFIKRELKRIFEAYGNHPSFCMFAIGNEIDPRGDYATLAAMIGEAKNKDARRLYSVSTARSLTWVDDFLVTHLTPGGKGTRGLRGPDTDWDFSSAVKNMGHIQPNIMPPPASPDSKEHSSENQYEKIPLIAHEIGQRVVYPDYGELKKYTGPLRPRSVEAFRDKAAEIGLVDLARDFQLASGRFACLLYKAEMETMLRTPGFGGFQLLQLNDFPGQGEALVGLLDSFWHSKGIVEPARFREFCCETVPLLRCKKYVWTNDETFEARAIVAHYGPKTLAEVTLSWSIADGDGNVLTRKTLPAIDLTTGKLNDVGSISLVLSDVKDAQALEVLLEIDGTQYRNRWNIWVFPATYAKKSSSNSGCLISNDLDKPTLNALTNGRCVLLLPDPEREYRSTAPARFLPTYWSAGWFPQGETQTLGIFCDPRNPALRGFPTDCHSDWQWFDIFTRSRVFVMDDIPPDQYTPVIRSISDYHQNSHLLLIFETKVEKGRLLVCGFDLSGDLQTRPAARQLLQSLKNYVESEQFRPSTTMPIEVLKTMFGAPAQATTRIPRAVSENPRQELGGVNGE